MDPYKPKYMHLSLTKCKSRLEEFSALRGTYNLGRILLLFSYEMDTSSPTLGHLNQRYYYRLTWNPKKCMLF